MSDIAVSAIEDLAQSEDDTKKQLMRLTKIRRITPPVLLFSLITVCGKRHAGCFAGFPLLTLQYTRRK